MGFETLVYSRSKYNLFFFFFFFFKLKLLNFFQGSDTFVYLVHGVILF